jgi:GT2 family glycosyltransferase
MKIAFIFTNYNNFKHSFNVVESISKLSNNYPIIIVDNMSNNDDKIQLNELEKLHNNLKVIYNENNIGYFKGLNIGIEYLRNNVECDFMVIGNNDLIFPMTFIEDFKKNHEILNKYAVISPNIITLDNECQNPHVLYNISKIRHIIYDIYYMNYTISIVMKFLAISLNKLFKRKDYLYSENAGVIYQGYGACYILGPIFFKFYNQLFAPTFLMGEEFFLSYQLKLQNLELYYEPTIKVYHQDHATTGMIESHKFWKISKESHKIYKKYLRSYE